MTWSCYFGYHDTANKFIQAILQSYEINLPQNSIILKPTFKVRSTTNLSAVQLHLQKLESQKKGSDFPKTNIFMKKLER